MKFKGAFLSFSLICTVSLSMILTTTPILSSTSSNTFKDLTGNWAKPYIQELAKKVIVECQ